MNSLPIGVFDSGIGGLTVLAELARTLPHESFVFLGDTARLPYGSKSPDTIRRYVAQNIEFLKEWGVKAIVIACNSASSVLEDREDWGVPTFGVIHPGAKRAASQTRNQKIGVLGTNATVSQGRYALEIKRLDPKIEVIQQACPLLVPLVEEGWEADSVTEEVIQRYVSGFQRARVDTVILGCTHYPVLKPLFSKVFGEGVHLVDSAVTVSEEVASYLSTHRLQESSSFQRQIQILVTDLSPTYERIARRLLKSFPIEKLESVHLTH